MAEAAQGHAAVAETHREVALAAIEQLSDTELAPHLEALYNLCWAENYLEHYDTAVARADRALAIARATGAGRMLVPLMLVKVYPFEMQGHMAATIELCETALEAERLAPNPHYRFWALFELGWARYYAGDPDGAIDACEESAALGHRMRGGTMPSTGGGPGFALGTARLAVGELERAAELLYRVGGEQLEHMVPVERCFDWEELVLLELGAATSRAPRRTRPRRGRAAGSGCGCRRRSRSAGARRCSSRGATTPRPRRAHARRWRTPRRSARAPGGVLPLAARPGARGDGRA